MAERLTASSNQLRVRPTIRDVAANAGVSVKTVSRVLNNEPGVATQTAARVGAAADALGFQRNEAAANLRRLDRSTRLLGLVTEDVSNPFYSVLADAIEAVARQHGFLLMVASSNEDASVERDVLMALCTRRADGLIVVPTGTDHSFLAPEIAAGTALVFVDRPGINCAADAVVAANADGAEAGVAHLLAHGHRKIGFVGDAPGIYTAAERHQGYLRALEAGGIPYDPDLVCVGCHDAATAEVAVGRLLGGSAAPTAIFSGNNRSTVGAFRAIASTGRDVALVGFDDFELADLLRPAVTVVAQDVRALGRTAAELLFTRLGGERRPPALFTLETHLVLRGSGEIAPVSPV